MAPVWAAASGQAPRCASRRTLCAAIAVAPWCSARRASSASRDAPSDIVCRLDLQRFSEPAAITLTLRRDGSLNDLRYVPARLRVTAAHLRTLPSAELERWRARASDPSLVEAMRLGPFGRAGLSQGDQFKLWVGEQGQPMRMTHGFVDDTPAMIRGFIAELSAAAERPAQRSALAAAYVRAEPLAPDREASLRSAGRVRFVAMGELEADARARVAAAVRDPFEFHPLTRDQVERLLAHRAHGAELFVAPEGHEPASQLVLFSTRD